MIKEIALENEEMASDYIVIGKRGSAESRSGILGRNRVYE